MQFKPSRLFGILILLIGALFYTQNIMIGKFFVSSSILFTSLIAWLLFTLVFDEFDNQFFTWLVFFSGLFLTVGVFLSYGIEEIPYPEGAHVFHIQGVAISLFILFASLLPLIILSRPINQIDSNADKHQLNSKKEITLSDTNDAKKDIESKILVEDDEWEQASQADIDSGEFEKA